MRTLAKNLLVLSALALVVIYFAHIFPRMQKGLDFPDFYAAARARALRSAGAESVFDSLLRPHRHLFHPSSVRSPGLFAICLVAAAMGLRVIRVLRHEAAIFGTQR